MTDTRVLKTSAETPDPEVIQEAAGVLRQGGLVAFPTETVYGLGADALHREAIQRVFEAKGRPSDNPLIIHVASLDHVAELAEGVPEAGRRLAQSFWPGPLTLVLRRTALVPDLVTAGLDTVAVRMPDHPVALALIAALDGGIVGPSANLSGRPSPTTAGHVYEDLAGRVEIILDGGPCRIGVESTVVDVTVEPAVILRPGGLARECIEEVLGPLGTGDDLEDLRRRSPGTRHRHYAPRARLAMVDLGDSEGLRDRLQESLGAQLRTGCIVHTAGMPGSREAEVFMELPDTVEGFARELFRAIRNLDRLGVDLILVEQVEEKGLGAAVMDRLRRAAESGTRRSGRLS